MNVEIDSLEFHKRWGKKIKYALKNLEVLKAELHLVYPKSAKENKSINDAIAKIELTRNSLHSQMMRENVDKTDEELLPVYMGRDI